MTETSAAVPATEPPKAKSPKKKTASAAKGAKAAKPSHPPTATMVNAAIKTLKERGGSSLQAIKKYISSTYKVDAEKLAPFIRKYIKNAVASGKLVQTKGNGAAGSFKLPSTAGAAGDAGKKKAPKPKTSKKKAAASPSKKEKKAVPKAKKAKKPPTTPKAPKPKKTTTKSAAKPKKPVVKKVAKKPVAKKTSPKKK